MISLGLRSMEVRLNIFPGQNNRQTKSHRNIVVSLGSMVTCRFPSPSSLKQLDDDLYEERYNTPLETTKNLYICVVQQGYKLYYRQW